MRAQRTHLHIYSPTAYMHVFACRPDKGSHIVEQERLDYVKRSDKLEDVTCGACLTSPLRKEAEKAQKRRKCDELFNRISTMRYRIAYVTNLKTDAMWRKLPKTGRDSLNTQVEAIQANIKRLEERRAKLTAEINAVTE